MIIGSTEGKKDKRRIKLRTKITTIVIVLFFLIGIGFIAYPIIGAVVSDYTSTKVIQNYDNQMSSMDKKSIEKTKNKLKEINKELKQIIKNPFENLNNSKPYKERKKFFKEGTLLGYLSIPKIDVLQPICEGTKESTLSHSVGHLNGTSMPYGGKSTHCCLTGHSGLSYSKMLSELDKIKVDDIFYIKTLNEKHQYKVDTVQIVKPYGANKYLKIEKDKDYVTLATCYPVTINTHRLLVRGHRVPYDGGLDEALKQKLNEVQYKIIALAVISLFIISSIVTIYIIRKRKSRRT